MNRKDWTLLAIAAAKGAPLDPAQLQKSLFLLGQHCKKELKGGFYAFQPYHYGPFDADVYRDAELLEGEALVEIARAGSLRKYTATPQGLIAAKQLRAAAPRKAAEYLSAVVEWARALSFQELIRAVYAAHPEMAANSVFRR